MNEEYLELWTFSKSLDDIAFSTYYYSKEKYISICEDISDNIWKEEFIKFKNKYKNPVKFTEDYLGIKLHWYQRALLEMMCKKENLLYGMSIRRVLK